MAKTLTITLPDEAVPNLIESLCNKGNHAQNGDLTLGDAGRESFAMNVLADMLGECLYACERQKTQEANQARNQAEEAALREQNAAVRQAIQVAIKTK